MIKSSFYSFETAKRAIQNSQLGLDVTGNNVANVNTGGYTRQRVDQVSFGSSGYRTKIKLHNLSLPGQGSAVTGIGQVRDPFLDNRYRAECANAGELAIKGDILEGLTNIIDEILNDGGIHSKLGDLLAELDVLIGTASSRELSNTVFAQFNLLAQMLNKEAAQLETLLTQYYDEFTVVTESVNSLLRQITEVNRIIREEEFYGNSPLELYDQRNVLIDELSQYIDIQVEYKAEKLTDGRTVSQCNIYLKGVTYQDNNEKIYLVEGTSHNEFAVEPTGKDALERILNYEEVTLTLVDSVSGLEIRGNQGNLNKFFDLNWLGGQLGGYVDMLNGTGGEYPGNNDYRGIQYYRKSLDDFALTFATVMNKLNVPDYSSRVDSLVDYLANSSQALTQAQADLAALNPTDEDYQNKADALNKIIKTETQNIDEYLMRLGETVEFYFDEIDPLTGVVTPTLYDPVNHKSYFEKGYVKMPLNLYIEDGLGNTIDLLVNNERNPDLLIHPQEIDDDGNVTKLLIEDTGVVSGNPAITIDIADPSITLSGDPMMRDTAVYKPLFTWDSRIARSIKVTEQWAANTDTWLTITSGYGIAGEADSGYANNLQRMKDALVNGPGEYGIHFEKHFDSGFMEYIVAMQTNLGSDAELNDTLLTSSLTVLATIINERDAVSAVNSDEEAVNMMIYQNYYNAAARYMTTLDEALGTVIQSMGVVGR